LSAVRVEPSRALPEMLGATVLAGATGAVSTMSCGAVAFVSLLANDSSVGLVVVSARLNKPFLVTSGVTSTETQLPAVNAPVEAVGWGAAAGAFEKSIFVSFQEVSATERTAKPTLEVVVAQRRRVAFVTGPPRLFVSKRR
jgi:hypothetical protein